MNKVQPDPNLVKWLSQYFVQRGDRSAQVTQTNLQTLLLQGRDEHIQSSRKGHTVLDRYSRNSQRGGQNGSSLQKSHNNSVGSLNPSTNSPSIDSKVAPVTPAVTGTLAVVKPAVGERPDIYAILIDLVTARIGGSKQSMRLKARLLDALHLEFILARALIVANTTLKMVAEAIEAVRLTIETVLNPRIPAIADATYDSSRVLLKLVEAQTGFPKASLALDRSVLDDLNFDDTEADTRRGSVKNLACLGHGAISNQEGVDRDVNLFQCDPSLQEATRLDGLNRRSMVPLPPTDQRCSDLRFIEHVHHFEPGVALTVRTHLSLERDLYVNDYVWRGSYLFPTVFGLEAMAQAVAYLTGEAEPAIVRIENLTLRRPIVVNPTLGMNIEIHATVAETNAVGEQSINVSIRTAQTGFIADHVSAVLVLGQWQAEQQLGNPMIQACDRPLAIEPAVDLYGRLLFQGTLFQQIDAVFCLSQERSLLQSHAHTAAALQERGFPIGQGSRLVLGDPYCRDVLLQCIQLNIPQDLCVPAKLDRIDFCQNPALADGTRFITAMLKQRVGQEYIWEVITTDAAGTVVERLQGCRLRVLEAHPERMVALVVEQAKANVSTDTWTPCQAEASIDPYGVTANREHREPGTEARPQAQPVYEKRFPVTFKESCGVSRHVTLSQYISWVGKMRELPLRGMAADLLPDLLSGEWDMVTNTVSLRVLGEATTYDTIQARCWIGNVINSTFDTYIEFCKVLPDETLERLALAEVRATWVQPVSDDASPTQSFPTYLQAYLERFSPQVPDTIALKYPPTSIVPPLPTHLASLNPGAILYRPQTHRYGDLLLSEVFQTTLEESNLTGNIYYGSYFTWQGRMLDLFLYAIAPEYLRLPTAQGEMLSLHSRIDFRQEALPFDRIQVALYVQSVSECGAIFKFEFFRERSAHCKEKLHTGQQEVIWVDRQPDGTPVATPWPQSIRQALMQRQTAELMYAANVS